MGDDDSSGRIDDRDRDARIGRGLSGGSDRLPLAGVEGGIPRTRKGQRSLSEYARAVAIEVLRESSRPGPAHSERDESGSARLLFDGWEEDEPDTAVSRVLAPLQSAQLAKEHRQVSMAPPAPNDDDEAAEGNQDGRDERKSD